MLRLCYSSAFGCPTVDHWEYCILTGGIGHWKGTKQFTQSVFPGGLLPFWHSLPCVKTMRHIRRLIAGATYGMVSESTKKLRTVLPYSIVPDFIATSPVSTQDLLLDSKLFLD